jgi:hypothetical protein
VRFLSKNKVPVFLLLLSLCTCSWAGIQIYVLEHRADQKVKEWESRQLQKAIQISESKNKAEEKIAGENKKKVQASISKGNIVGLLQLPVSSKKLPISFCRPCPQAIYCLRRTGAVRRECIGWQAPCFLQDFTSYPGSITPFYFAHTREKRRYHL